MSIGFMVTNGGPHPPEKWADMTTRAIGDLIVIEPSAPTQAVIDKREFEMALFKLLVDLHGHTQEHERGLLHKHGHAHLSSPNDPRQQAVIAAARVTELAGRTRFASHFAKPAVQDFLFNVIGQHFADSVHIERSWHADRNRKDIAQT